MAVDTKTIGIPMSARPANDPRPIDGIAGLDNIHAALGDAVSSLYDISYKLSSDRILKNFDLPTIGSQIFDGNSSAAKFIRQFDPNNESGAVGFALNMVDRINDALDAEKLFKDIFGPQISCLIGLFADISDLVPQIQAFFPDIKGMLMDALQNIQRLINDALNNILDPIRNAIGTLTDAMTKVRDLIGKISQCALAT